MCTPMPRRMLEGDGVDGDASESAVGNGQRGDRRSSSADGPRCHGVAGLNERGPREEIWESKPESAHIQEPARWRRLRCCCAHVGVEGQGLSVEVSELRVQPDGDEIAREYIQVEAGDRDW